MTCTCNSLLVHIYRKLGTGITKYKKYIIIMNMKILDICVNYNENNMDMCNNSVYLNGDNIMSQPCFIMLYISTISIVF